MELVVASYRAWRPFFEQIDGCRLESFDDVMRWTSNVPLPFFNGVFGSPGDADLDAILAPFADGRPLIWVAAVEDALIAGLEQRGFKVDAEPAMTMPLRDLPPLELQPGVELRELGDDHALLGVAARIALLTNGFPEEAVEPFLTAFGRSEERYAMRTFLATVDGEPAATSLLLTEGGSAGLYDVGTLEPHRRRGLGRLVSLAALHAGREAGLETGTLTASSLGAPVYRAIGFAEVGRMIFAVRA